MYEKILKISQSLKSKFYFDYNIFKSTWFQAGGKADIFCIVYNENELEVILNQIENYPYLIIGSGSNLLIRDGGYKGLILRLGKSFEQISLENNKILAGARALDVNLSKFAFLNNIKNFEFFSGIPGSIGGAVKMNAGCFGNETKNVINKIFLIKKNGKKYIANKNDLNFSYRKSNLNDEIVLKAEFKVAYSDKIEIKEKIDFIRNNRKLSQPIKSKTGGSTFKNPKNLHAAKLIELSGCKNLAVGDALVSSKHANFLINSKNASATQIEDLGNMIIDKVYSNFDILLEWEIQIVGDKKK